MWVSWCKNKYFWQRFTCITVIQSNGEERDEFEIQSRSPINADPIHLQEENVESLGNNNAIRPLQVPIENNEPNSIDVENQESKETPEMPDQIVLCYNNRKFNPSMIRSTGLSFLFVIIFIVGPLLIWKYFLFVGYENLELKTHIYYCLPIALPIGFFIANPKHLIPALKIVFDIWNVHMYNKNYVLYYIIKYRWSLPYASFGTGKNWH